MKNKIIWFVVIIAIVLVGFYASKNKDSGEKSGEPIKIGVATLLSGDLAAAGENMANAARLAVDEVNANGGINGQQLELVIEDAKCDSAGGLNAMQKLVNIDGVRYVVGGMCSNGTIASAPLANEKQVIVMTPVTGGKNVDEAGEYIFRLANSDVLAGRDIANAMIKLGYKKVGVVAEITEYTLDIKNTFEKVFAENGGQIIIGEEFQPGTKDYRTLVAKVKAAKPEALLILSQLGTNAAQFIKQMRELNYSAPLFTDFTLIANTDAKKIAGSFEGIYFADPAYDSENQKTKEFFVAYQERFGKASLIPFHAASSYDAVMMFADGLKAVGNDSKKVKNWLLENVKNRTGLMGTFSLDQNGNSDLGFVIRQVRGDQFVKLEN